MRIILRGPAQLERAHEVLNATPLREKKPLEMVIRPMKDERTAAQNALYWACLGQAANELGYSRSELHEVLLTAHFGAKTLRFGGTEVQRPLRRTTTDEDGARDPLTKEEMSRYFEWAMAFVAEQTGIRV